MTTLPPVDERAAAEIGLLLSGLPFEQVKATLLSSGQKYFGAALSKGWTVDEASKMTLDFSDAIMRHWQGVMLAKAKVQ